MRRPFGARLLGILAVSLAAGSILAAPVPAADPVAGSPRRIVLGDGSVLVAEVVSLDDGWYTLRSASLGELRIAQERIARIERVEPEPAIAAADPPAAGARPEAVDPQRVREIQGRLVEDGTSVAALLRLGSSPAMQAVLSDPELMAAVRRGDLETLRKHPKMRALMEDPDVAALTGRIAGESEAGRE